jgi:transcriptional regulator PpsR
VTPFKAPKKWLGTLDAEVAARLIATSADVALVLDAKGIVRDAAFGSEELAGAVGGPTAWAGRAWADTVTVESRQKIEALLRDAAGPAASRWRQVNHPMPGAADVPVIYAAVDLQRDGRVVAVGRDLRAVAALQQRLVDAQQAIERDYWRLRHAETRYRLLFQTASEGVLVVDAASQKVVEANPAAARLLGDAARRLVGRTFPDGLDAAATKSIQAMLAAARAAGRADDVRIRAPSGADELIVSASLFRQDNASLYLVRLLPARAAAGAPLPEAKAQLLEVVEHAPDAIVVTDADGRVLSANRAFRDLAQLASEEQARGESLDRWLGRPGVDLNVLLTNLRQHGAVRLFATTLRGEVGAVADVEISAVSVHDAADRCHGFAIRNVGRRLSPDPRAGRELPRSVEQLTELVGRVALKDLVREATDLIERLCIEAALDLTGDNRASAAEMLGLSRQSLYVKLRRYGLGDLAPETDKG